MRLNSSNEVTVPVAAKSLPLLPTMILRVKDMTYHFPRPTLVMGILNVTPDSFSDGSKYSEPKAAVARGMHLLASGADWIDVGGESTRPGAPQVSCAEEIRRVIPVIQGLREQTNAIISIDTQKPEVAHAAIAEGAQVVNDIGANRSDDTMWKLIAETGVGYVAMHMQGNPQTMQSNPHYGDAVQEVRFFFKDRLEFLSKAGVNCEQVILDVGIGFGKSLQHNLELIAALTSYQTLLRPILLGVSRKSFIGEVTGAGLQERLAGGLACGLWGVQCGVQILRTHDVAETRQAVQMTELLVQLKNKRG